jgi:Arc/MetJ family transcription regulator
MTKQLIEVDEDTLTAARAELGTSTVSETVNAALQIAAKRRNRRVQRALDFLATLRSRIGTKLGVD